MRSLQCVALTFGCMLLASVGITAPLPAQSVTGSTATIASPTTASGKDSLVRFVSSEKLVLLLESFGLKSQTDAWQKTNAYKLLTDTPLGSMLELVSTQFLDQLLATDSNRKVTGAEVVSLIKHVALNGWVFALNASDKGPHPYRATIVVRGATSKVLRPITSRLLGVAMGEIRPRIVRKDNRTIVAVDVPSATAPAVNAAAPGSLPKVPVQTWVWWAEQDDLVIGVFPGDDGDLMVNTVDGKAPSALTHPGFLDAKNADGADHAIVTRFVDFNALNNSDKSSWITNVLLKAKEITGSQALVQRVGLDDHAIVTTTRLLSPKPFSSVSSLFEAPSFRKTDLIPMPDGVHSFATISIKAERVPGLVDLFDPSGDFKLKLLEFTQTLKTSSRIDLEKDLLERLGPKMTVYLSPVRSAAAEDEPLSLQSLFSGGINLTSLMALTRPFVPEATLVAELKDPVAFGKALDSFIIAVNKEFKAKATELEEAEGDQAEVVPEAGRRRGEEAEPASRGRRGAAGAGGDRNKNRKPAEVLYPKFNPIASPTNVRKFQLSTPSSAKYRLGPTHFRPVIYMDLKHLVVAASAGTAEAAIEALGKKNWKPGSDLQEALSSVSSDVVAIAVIESEESTSSLLSSFPGTMQTYINNGIAISKLKAPQAAAPQPAAAPVVANNPAQGRDARMRRGRRDDEVGFMTKDEGRRQGEGIAPPPGSGGAPGGQPSLVAPQMVQFQVGSDQLPKSQEIKALLFPTTISILADDKGLKVTQRSAFPEHLGLESNATAIGFLMPLVQAARAQLRAGAPASAPANGPAQNTPVANPNAGGKPRDRADFDAAGNPRNLGRRGRDD